MDLTNIAYLLGFVLLILIVSLFIKDDSAHSKSHTNLKLRKTKRTYNSFSQNVEKSKMDTNFENIISFLENEVKLRYGKNKIEKDYQDDLFQAFGVLRERHGYEIKYESKNGRHRVDFSVNDSIGIELKVHRGGAQVKKELFNQLTDYANYYPKMIGIVVNVSDKDAPSKIRDDIYCKMKQQNVISQSNYYIIILNILSR
ncbi:GxxExxY protein [Methanolobus chelungpuianus]|uniref:Uncharacterized protein n=1 Tax=Methanolobus chelungpuianus TaxID=502115 RepID=A0AAE3H9U8_9EURY|nr:GxxExxY protein [Methanolobus chelungpuianus]MCQ6962625.1 hypothetical protein [Methanolobus chelungpuianus]